MKRITTFMFLLLFFLSRDAGATIRMWQRVDNNIVTTQGERRLFPQIYTSFYLNNSVFQPLLFSVAGGMDNALELELPQPDGAMRTYRIWQTPMMEAPLAEKYPGMRTLSGYAVDDKAVTVKLDYTYKGFHAKVFDGEHTYFIDPYSTVNDGFYICYYKKDYQRPAGKTMHCEVVRNHEETGGEEIDMADAGLKEIAARTNGTTQKTYRLALACTIEYSQAVDGSSPTTAGVLSAMVTSINRVNGVYERELAVTMTLIANTDQLIYLSGTDPYTNGNGSAMLSENQANVNAVIGSSNYDFGHVFSTGGGGIASLGSVCTSWGKAQGVTGSPSPLGDPFDIDYVAHEMGHQFGANHPFNANTGSCSGNGERATAYEPGSGSTIMAYAGICGNSDNLQNHSDDYFHSISLVEMSNYITVGNGANCPVQTPIANAAPTLSSFSANYSIPYLTPFELTAPVAADGDHDILTYCWEQWNLGDFRSSWPAANLKGPIFRSFYPDVSETRVFVALPKLISNITSYVGEKLPQGNRYLTFRLTVRDMLGTMGSFSFPDDTVHLDVINTGTPFAVTNPNTGVSWTGGAAETFTWNVANTDAAPISTPNVDISLSVDGGLTYPYTVATNVINDGSETLIVPNVPTTSNARVKIKGAGNVFFDISNFDFTITNDPNLPVATGVANTSMNSDVQLFPIPATKELHIKNDHNATLNITIFNTMGQQVWNGSMAAEQIVNVTTWARGLYYMQLTDTKSKERTVKKFIVE